MSTTIRKKDIPRVISETNEMTSGREWVTSLELAEKFGAVYAKGVARYLTDNGWQKSLRFAQIAGRIRVPITIFYRPEFGQDAAKAILNGIIENTDSFDVPPERRAKQRKSPRMGNGSLPLGLKHRMNEFLANRVISRNELGAEFAREDVDRAGAWLAQNGWAAMNFMGATYYFSPRNSEQENEKFVGKIEKSLNRPFRCPASSELDAAVRNMVNVGRERIAA